jgi:hypothetical protein
LDALFGWIETSALSTWIRESPSLWVFPFILILHTVGLAFLVGAIVAIDARIIGLAVGLPVASMDRYFAVMWFGFWTNAVSGLLLLIAYPTKALTNPLFYAKLTLIAAGLAMTLPLRRHMREAAPSALTATPTHLKLVAAASLLCWSASIIAGRLLAYTYTRLMVDFPP